MRIFLLLFVMVAQAFGQGTKARPESARDPKIDAPALIKEILGRPPTVVREVVGTLKIRNADNKVREVKMRWTVRPQAGEWNDVYQTPRNGEIPPEDLIITHREASTNSYIYNRAGAPIPEIATNLFVPFGTSDFWVVDLGLEFLHWPNPMHLKTEMRSSRPCYVIETRNPRPGPGVYSRVVCWIDTEKGGLIRAEAYDDKNQLFKEFYLRGFKKVEGQWQVSAMEIQNEKTDSKTTLEFDLQIQE